MKFDEFLTLYNHYPPDDSYDFVDKYKRVTNHFGDKRMVLFILKFMEVARDIMLDNDISSHKMFISKDVDEVLALDNSFYKGSFYRIAEFLKENEKMIGKTIARFEQQ